MRHDRLLRLVRRSVAGRDIRLQRGGAHLRDLRPQAVGVDLRQRRSGADVIKRSFPLSLMYWDRFYGRNIRTSVIS